MRDFERNACNVVQPASVHPSVCAACACTTTTPALPATHPIQSNTVVEGWLDLARLVSSEGIKAKGPYDELAYKIGTLRRRAA